MKVPSHGIMRLSRLQAIVISVTLKLGQVTEYQT